MLRSQDQVVAEDSFLMFQDIADKADGDNVLIVTHGDAVNSSVSRIMPWAIVYPVLHTGFTVAYRDQHQGMKDITALPIHYSWELSCVAHHDLRAMCGHL